MAEVPYESIGLSHSTFALRSAALTFTGDPFFEAPEDCVVYEPDGLLVVENGVISQFGPASKLLRNLPESVPVTHYPNGLALPGFIDCHVHYPQVDVIGSHGTQLLDWLNRYTFPAEQRFSDRGHAEAAADLFLDECLKAGTTTAAVFCTVDALSAEVFFEASAKRNMRNLAGKVLMDTNAPAALLDTPQSAYDDSKKLIDRWHGRGRALYAITPRFAATSSREQMEVAGILWRENAGTYLQSHVSENRSEIAWIQELFPECDNYVDVYLRYGHLGARSIFGHGIHLSESERQVLHDTGTAIAHCPTSNLFLGSGLFDFEAMTRPERPVRFGLATDVGGGTHLSQLVSMNEAYKIAQLGGYSLTAFQALYSATGGAARALYLDDRIGSLAPGMEADITVLDSTRSELLTYRLSQAESLEETLFALIMLGDDRLTAATYVAGERLYAAPDR